MEEKIWQQEKKCEGKSTQVNTCNISSRKIDTQGVMRNLIVAVKQIQTTDFELWKLGVESYIYNVYVTTHKSCKTLQET